MISRHPIGFVFLDDPCTQSPCTQKGGFIHGMIYNADSEFTSSSADLSWNAWKFFFDGYMEVLWQLIRRYP